MKERRGKRCGSYLIVCSALLATSLGATAGEEFATEFFAPITLTKTIESRPTLGVLTDTQKKDLTAVKHVLTDFLIALTTNKEDPLSFLTPELREKYKSRTELYKQEFGDEAYISASIFEFEIISEGRSVDLRLLLTGTTEGTDCTYQRQFTLRKSGQRWLISKF